MSSFKKKKIATKAPTFANIQEERDSSLPTLELKEGWETKKTTSWKRIAFCVFLVLILVGWVFAGKKAFESNSQNGSESFKPPLVDEIFSKKVKGTTNILITGIGWKGHEGADLTDSIMLASLNEDTKQVTLLSIPRDLYIAYPGGKGAGRINSLYDLWKRDKVGIQYLADKVSEITGQPIDHYMVIDFSGFRQIVDILWGIDVEVPNDLIDREYPDDNWGWEVFSVKKWLQKMNGTTALKYARSRHSTSDFDRSNRQQLIIKAIKEKALSLGYITNPVKLWDLYNAVISHLDTDMSVANMAAYGLTFRDVSSDKISIVSLTNECASLIKCMPGSFLYSPSRDLFGGAAVIIPENAQANKLSYYTDIQRFVWVTFAFPGMRNMEKNIVIISDPTEKKQASEIGYALAKIGFPLSSDKIIGSATGVIEQSHINIYWHSDLQIGIRPDSEVMRALQMIEKSIPVTVVDRNEYVSTSGPKIEIVIWRDIKNYFSFVKTPYYMPFVSKESISWEKKPIKVLSWTTSSQDKKPNTSPGQGSIKTTIPKNTHTPSTPLEPAAPIQPGEWESF